MNPFSSTILALECITGNPSKYVSRKEYDQFCKEFVFEKIKGKRFGEAFTEKFGFNGLTLNKLSDEVAKYHIECLGYIK